jgi:hypothetical protein
VLSTLFLNEYFVYFLKSVTFATILLNYLIINKPNLINNAKKKISLSLAALHALANGLRPEVSLWYGQGQDR